jgi:uncharacterized protein (TIGR03086 family)
MPAATPVFCPGPMSFARPGGLPTMNTDQELIDLRPAARQLAALLDGVGEDRFDAPTPCPDYRVRDLLQHLMGLTLAFRDAGRKDLGPGTSVAPDAPDAPRPALDGDWRERLRAQAAEMADAWRAPEAWEGDTQAGGVTFPAAIAGRVALDELVMHGWDLARATGQPFTCDDASAEVCIALLSQDADEASRAGTGFGPVVPVPAGASALERAVGLSGRDPAWTPPGAATA